MPIVSTHPYQKVRVRYSPDTPIPPLKRPSLQVPYENSPPSMTSRMIESNIQYYRKGCVVSRGVNGSNNTIAVPYQWKCPQAPPHLGSSIPQTTALRLQVTNAPS